MPARASLLAMSALATASLSGMSGARTVAAPVEAPIPVAEWAKVARPPAGAANILVILMDDVGFSAGSTFGGPIPTPHFEALARRGLRYNRFHVTAICGPTRAALLTGRNHNAVNMGYLPELPGAEPGYQSIIPRSAATIAKLLAEDGYATAMIGKANFTPEWETGPTGPFDHWPTGLGFEHFYGFMTAETNQYVPALYEDTRPVDPPKIPGYILDKDLADHAIEWLRTEPAAASDKPFFLYYATGSTHAPHQAPREWIDKFRGQFDEGWDKLREDTLRRQIAGGIVPRDTKLAPRPTGIPFWKDISPVDRKLYARQMEVYAGMLAYADDQIGRVLDELGRLGQADNTLVFLIEDDNGASGEGQLTGVMNQIDTYNGFKEDMSEFRKRMDELGGPTMSGHYASGWAMALNTPFPWMKQYASHLGGTRNGMIVSWPKRIKQVGQIRQQYTHVIDVMPTILSAADVAPPAVIDGSRQQPIDGIDMSYSFANPKAPSRRHIQYYDMKTNAGIYEDGWLAGTTPISVPWIGVGKAASPTPFADRKWELYYIDRDFSQSTNVAAEYPDKLSHMKSLYLREAKRNSVKPGYSPSKFYSWRKEGDKPMRLSYAGPRLRLPWGVAPDFYNRSFALDIDLDTPTNGANGVLLTQGGRFGGFALYMLNSKLAFLYNAAAAGTSRIVATEALGAGHHRVAVNFDYDGGGLGKGGGLTIKVDGEVIGQGRITQTIPVTFTIDESFDIGQDTGTTVGDDYALPATFSGTIRRVGIELGAQSNSG